MMGRARQAQQQQKSFGDDGRGWWGQKLKARARDPPAVSREDRHERNILQLPVR